MPPQQTLAPQQNGLLPEKVWFIVPKAERRSAKGVPFKVPSLIREEANLSEAPDDDKADPEHHKQEEAR